MPQDLGCRGPVRAPTLADLREDGRLRRGDQLQRFGGGHLEGAIAGRPDVGAPQTRHEEDVRSPRTDTRDGGQFGSDLVVRAGSERGRIQPTVDHPTRQLSAVSSLLSAEADIAELLVGESSEGAGLDPRYQRVESVVCGPGRIQGDLLLQDQQNQRLECRRPSEAAWMPVVVDDARQMDVGRREVLDRRPEC